MTMLRWTVRTLGELLITLGLLLFLFVAWQLWWTDVTANREQAITIHALERAFGPPALSPHGSVSSPLGWSNSLATPRPVPFAPRPGSNVPDFAAS